MKISSYFRKKTAEHKCSDHRLERRCKSLFRTKNNGIRHLRLAINTHKAKKSNRNHPFYGNTRKPNTRKSTIGRKFKVSKGSEGTVSQKKIQDDPDKKGWVPPKPLVKLRLIQAKKDRLRLKLKPHEVTTIDKVIKLLKIMVRNETTMHRAQKVGHIVLKPKMLKNIKQYLRLGVHAYFNTSFGGTREGSGGRRFGRSLLDDESYSAELLLHIREVLGRRRAYESRKNKESVPPPRLNSRALTKFINKTLVERFIETHRNLGMELQSTDVVLQECCITERTCRTWMKRLGFNWKTTKKGQYYDGHERKDVLEHRQRFVNTMEDFMVRSKTFQWDNEFNVFKLIERKDTSGKEVMFVNQDESVYHVQDDGYGASWVEEGDDYRSRPKGKGVRVHVSSFINYTTGKIMHTDTMKCAKGEVWTLEMLREQQKLIMDMEPEKYEIVFMYDNSTIHTRLSPEALRANMMGVKPGGKQNRAMQSTTWNGKEQTLQFKEGDTLLFDFSNNFFVFTKDGSIEQKNITKTKTISGQKVKFQSTEDLMVLKKFKAGVITKDNERSGLIGEPKGMRQLLMERGLMTDQMIARCGAVQKRHSGSCCMLGCLLNCSDFSTQDKLSRSVLFKDAVERGHHFLLLPKYHCELAPIERVWAVSKRYCRLNSTYTVVGLMANIKKSMSLVTATQIRQFFNRCFLLCRMYLEGTSTKDCQKHLKNRTAEAGRAYKAGRRKRERAENLSMLKDFLKNDIVKRKTSHRRVNKKVDNLLENILK